MVLAIPSPQETIDRLLERLVNEHPDIDPESFRLPIGELCNYECNVLSVRNVVPMLECYLIEKASKSGEPISEASDRNILGELVDVIIDNPDEHFVIVEGKRAGLTLDYLRNKENWISNHTAAAFVNNFAKVLGPEYSDLDVILSPDNPWLKVSRHVLQNPTDDFGVIQQLAVLWGGPREVYSHVMTIGAYFNRAILYEVHEDAPISPMKRRMRLMAHWVNEFEAPVEYLGQNLAILAETPNLFSYNRLLKRIPGFNLGMADVSVEFPDGSYNGRWDITVDYNTLPFKWFENWRERGETYEIIKGLSGRVTELTRDKRILEDEVKEQTEAYRIESEARLQAERLAALGRLAAQISHETKTPLQATRDELELLRDEYLYLVFQFQDVEKLGLDESFKTELYDLIKLVFTRSAEVEYRNRSTIESLAETLYENLKNKYKGITLSTCEDMAAMGYGNDVSDLDHLLQADNPADITAILRRVFNVGFAIHNGIRASDRQMKIVNALLEHAHVDRREIEAVDINEKISATLTLFDKAMSDAGIKVETEFDEGLGLVECNVVRMNDVYRNLIENALDALRDWEGEKTQRIKTQKDGDWAIVEITDTGPGIPEGDIDKIFEPMYTTKKVGEGTGLGLSIVYNTMKEHQGDVQCSSISDETTFRLRMPMKYQGKV